MKLKINNKDRILILTPHPDDESIGCGGLLLKYARQCDIILLTDGAKGNWEWSEEKTRKVRKNEFVSAMEWARARKWEMRDIPDSELNKHTAYLINIDLKRYKYVVVPNRNESHLDHRVIFNAIKKNIKKTGASIKILEYEVWTPLLKPTHYLDISNIIKDKEKLIQFYKCPLMHIDYDKRIIALNYYRGIHYDCEYAECYHLTDYSLGLWQKAKRFIKRINKN